MSVAQAARLLYLATFLFLFLYALANILAPLLISFDAPLGPIGLLFYMVSAYLCHQIPERSFMLYGQIMPQCSRCFGITLGALFAYPAAFSSFARKKLSSPWLILLSFAAVGIDGGTQLFGLRESDIFTRLVTGFAAAFFIVLYILALMQREYKFLGEKKTE